MAVLHANFFRMSAITQKRFQDVETAIFENGDYREKDDVTRAGKYITAVTRRIDMIPSEASRGSQGESVRFDLPTLELMLKRAEEFLNHGRSRAKAGFRLRGMTRMPLRDAV